MQKNSTLVKSKTVEETSQFVKRIGSGVYKVNVYFSQDSKETMNDKIYRLARNELKSPSKNGIIKPLRTERLPDGSCA